MAVDTRNKRMSLIGLGSPIPTVLPNPDGAFNNFDRAQLIWLYAGLNILIIGVIDLTLPTRSLAFTLPSRSLALTLPTRSLAFTLSTRDLALTLKTRSLSLTLPTR